MASETIEICIKYKATSLFTVNATMARSLSSSFDDFPYINDALNASKDSNSRLLQLFKLFLMEVL